MVCQYNQKFVSQKESGISTGVFGFPQEKAAEIAVDTIRTFLKTHEIEVICNVFSEKDFRIYQRLLG